MPIQPKPGEGNYSQYLNTKLGFWFWGISKDRIVKGNVHRNRPYQFEEKAFEKKFNMLHLTHSTWTNTITNIYMVAFLYILVQK